jgi:tripartite-type tricarboxylate transporter receptor subunit TctC
MICINKTSIWCAAILAAATVASTAQAQKALDFKGKTVTIAVSFEPGGPYDSYSRLFARHLGAHIPGTPTVIVQNMPGAGGLNGINYLYNVAPRDGTTLGVVSQKVAVAEALGTTPGIRYKTREMAWIGRIDSNVEVEHSWTASGFTSIDVAKQKEVVVAGTGPTSSSVVFPHLLNELVGTKFKVISGYRGPASAQLALERGEVSAIVRPWSSIKATSADLLKSKKITMIVQYTQKRHPELKDVPAVVDLADNDSTRQILGLFAAGGELGTSVVAPPKIPAATVDVLRKAFIDTMHSPELRNEAARTGFEIDPLPGADVQKIVADTFNVAPAVLERARKLSLKIGH